jgi:hypothetical protein
MSEPTYPTTIVINKSLEIECPVRVPTTLDGFLQIAPEQDLINAIMRHSFYQKWNNKFRKLFVEALVAHTKVDRRPKTNSAGLVIQRKARGGALVNELESEQSYMDYLLDDKIVTREDYNRIGLEIAATIPFEVSKAEEEKTPAKRYMDSAATILGLAEQGLPGPSGNVVTEEGFTANWSAANPGHNFEAIGGWTQIGIARAIEIDQARQLAAGGGLV